MPRVPTYDTPQVAPEALGAPRTASVATPDLLSGPAREQERRGQAISQAGLNVYKAMSEREDADQVFRAETALKDGYLQYEQDARKNRQGRFAKDLTADTGKWFDEQLQKHEQELSSGAAKRMFQQRAAGFRQTVLSSVSGYEAQQLEKSHDESWQASKGVTISTAAANATPEAIDGARAEIERLNRYQAARKGWEPEKLTAENVKDLTALHKNVIQQLVQKDPSAAAAYFEAHKSEIDGAQQAEIGKLAKDASATAIGEQAAGAAWEKFGPKGDHEPTNLDTIEAEARKALKGNDTALKSALAAIKERSVAFDKGAKEREASNASAVAQADMAGRPISAIQKMPEFLALSGTKQREMLEHMESTRYTRTARADAEESKREAEREKKYAAAYLAYSDPEALKTMSRNEVQALLPDLGRAYTEHLLAKWDGLQKPEKVVEAKVDTDDFNHVAQGAGLKPFDPKKDEEEKAMLGELRYRIEQRIDQEQARTKRPLTRAEKMQIMQLEMDNKVMIDRSFWFDASKPAVLLTDDELKSAYVVVDGQEIRLSSIPGRDRADIIAARRARNLPVTEQLVAQTWLRAKQPKRTAAK